MSFKVEQYHSIDERVDNFRLFYQRKNERPLFGFFVGSEFPLHRYKASKYLPEGRALTPDDFEVSRYLEDCDELFRINEACGGDLIWSASAFWGIPWLEAALGCSIYADHQTGSIHSEPPERFTDVKSIPVFDKNAPWVKKTSEFISKMAERSAGRWPVGTTRMRGISDLLSALYGSGNFLYRMLEEPDEIKGVCEKLADFWIEYGKLQLEGIPLFHGGVGSFYYNMWAPEGTVWHQEDAAALLSPGLYGEFIRPHDERIVKAFKGCIMHQHPTGYLPVNDYLTMGMTALELHVDEGGPCARALFAEHMKILESKPLLIWGKLSVEDLEWIFTKLPGRGLAVNTVISCKEEAAVLWNRYNEFINK